MSRTVYIETSVISYLTAQPSNDLRAMGNQSATVDWWETQRPKYEPSVICTPLELTEN